VVAVTRKATADKATHTKDFLIGWFLSRKGTESRTDVDTEDKAISVARLIQPLEDARP
jgi:hypothetical protein